MQTVRKIDRHQLESRIAHLRSTLAALEEQLHREEPGSSVDVVRRVPQHAVAAANSQQAVETPLPIAAG